MPYHQDAQGDPPAPLAPARPDPDCDGWIPTLLSNLHRALLRLRVRVGAQALLTLRHSHPRVRHSPRCYVLHHHRAHLLSACDRGPPLVVALSLQRRIHGPLHLPVLYILLQLQGQDERIHADVLLLRLHGSRVLWRVAAAGDCWVLLLPHVCQVHLPQHQVRLSRAHTAGGRELESAPARTPRALARTAAPCATGWAHIFSLSGIIHV
mmetsp:Transcript_6379/g.16094  ORF Transcript_6379/g.16094 Transcript_6379/m.16094 type:complete len:209 (-) Transcript_6379:34-660(-)